MAACSALLALVGCDTEAQFAPSLPLVAPLRVEGSALSLWTVTPCAQATRLMLTFRSQTRDNVRVVYDADRPVTVERLTLTEGIAGFTPREPFPDGFDWRDFQELTVDVTTTDGPHPASSSLATLADEGAARSGDGTSYVEGEGWLSDDEVQERDGRDFLAVCTPDPDGP